MRARRQQLHERIARTLEARFPVLADTEPEILAYHFSRADLPGEACAYSERAGERAAARSAFAEAVAHFEAALAEAQRMPAGADRKRSELAVLLKYGPATIVFKGHRSPQVEHIYRRAYDIAKSSSADPKVFFKAVWGLWFYAGLGRKTDIARERAEELVALATRSGDDALILEALHCRWSTAFFSGDVPRALADAREGVEHYDQQRHGRLAAEFGGHDPGVCARGVYALTLAQLGKFREAVDNLEQSIALAKRLNQPSSLAHAMLNALQAYQLIGDHAALMQSASELLEIADKFNLPLQRAIAMFYAGFVKALDGPPCDDIAMMEKEFPRLSATAALPQLYAVLLAGVHLKNGDAARAMALLDAALHDVAEPEVGFFLSEIHRLRAECLLRVDKANPDDAVREFDLAMTTAKRQEAPLLQLRAAISLARAIPGRNGSAQTPLRAAVAAFDGDTDIAEMVAAREILSHPAGRLMN